MLNIVALEGRLTAEPEMRHTQNDIAVTNFSLAVQRSRKNADGEYESDFFTVVAWRGTAELAAKYFKKGQLCVVEGILQQRHYTDREGNKRQAVEVVAQHPFCRQQVGGRGQPLSCERKWPNIVCRFFCAAAEQQCPGSIFRQRR